MRAGVEGKRRFAPASGRGDIVFVADDQAGALLDEFYDGYARAFVLPSERETIEGFRTCFALNGRRFAFAPQPFREVVMVVRDAATGTRLGGANFFVSLFATTACVALNYVYVEPDARGRGLLRELVAAVSQLAGSFLPVTTDATLQFIEVNDPTRLDEAASAADTAHSGLGQVERLAIWARLDARLIDHPYVQPPLSAAQDPDSSLALAVLGSPGDALDARLFAAHLRHFFGVSVLKGHDPADTPIAARQLDQVAREQAIALYPLGPVIERLEAGLGGASLIAMAREIAA